MNHIKQLRTFFGYTQVQLAKLLNVSRSAVAMWETTAQAPDYDTLLKLSQIFNLPVNYILGVGIFEKWDMIIRYYDNVVFELQKKIPANLEMPAFCDDEHYLIAWLDTRLHSKQDEMQLIRWFAFSISAVEISPRPDQLDGSPNADISIQFTSEFKAIIRAAQKHFQPLTHDPKNAPLYSSEAEKIAKDYDSLDHWGKAAVRSVADTELARMRDEARFLAETSLEPEPKVINLFTDPSAAGPALGVTGQSCEPYTLTPDDPQGAAYAIRVQGDSMEPDFPDGSIAFVNHDEMRDGDIGVFCVDGATVIKQWHYDPMLKITYLFSLNRKREDCDVVIVSGSGRSLVWQGRVLTRRRYDLPGRM